MDKVILFGAGNTGKRVIREQGGSLDILCIMDNDYEKHIGGYDFLGGYKFEVPSKENLLKYDFDYVLITSMAGNDAIRGQLIDYGIPTEKIKSIKQTPLSKIYYFENLYKLFSEKGIKGNMAEVGVFRGNTAEIMNRVFNDRILHLFDTFEGFSDKDIEVENELSYSDAIKGQYNDASVEFVMNRMSFPEQIRIHKGYFPDTAEGLEGEFCLVRVDLDLYKPTVAALGIFHSLMSHNGIMLVDDYFGDSYRGIKEAVDNYLSIHPNLIAAPLGDRFGIAIYGY